MSIQVGDSIPAASLKVMTPDGPQDLNTSEFFADKKVVLFAVPGAFTPTCSAAHLPGYVVHADAIKDKGVDAIVCMSVNDVFVMGAWGESQNAENIVMAADGNGEFATGLGLTMDGSGFGMGTRSQRFALIADKGVVTHLGLEEGGKLEHSAAEAILAQL